MSDIQTKTEEGRRLLIAQLSELNGRLKEPAKRSSDAIEGKYTVGQYLKGVKEISEAANELNVLEARLKAKGGRHGIRKQQTKGGTDASTAASGDN